jgi:hypothetical protein
MRRATLALLATLWLAPAARAEPDCAARLQNVRRILNAIEPDYVAKLYPPRLFLTGKANPEAQAALLPVLEPALKKAAGVPDLSLTLECRTWACRLLVLQPFDSSTAGWEKALASAPELAERLRGSGVAARRRTAETFGGQDLAEATVYFKLADRSGQPRPPGARFLARDRTTDPIPAPDLCPAKLEKTERALAAMQGMMARTLTPPERFQKEPANDELTRDMAARLRQASASLGLHGLAVQCRGVVCQVRTSVPLDAPSWQRLEARPELSLRIVGKAHQAESYWLIRPEKSADGKKVLDQVISEVEAEPFFDDCHARHPARGHLIVRYYLPGDSVFGKPGPRGEIRLEVTGSLADTPLARCLTDELTSALAWIPLPENRLGAARDRRYDWPRR